MSSTEYLSEDILEEDFVRTYRPFHWAQLVFGSCRVDARHRFVTAPSVYQKIYTCFCLIVTFTTTIACISLYFVLLERARMIVLLSFATMGVNLLAYALNLIHVRFMNNDANVDFYIRLQRIDRIMGIERNKTMSGILTIANTAMVTLTLATYIIMLSIASAKGIIIVIGCSTPIICQAVLALEICFCSNFIGFFWLRARFVRCILKNFVKPFQKGKHHNCKYIPNNCQIKYLAAQTHDFLTCDTYLYLQKIFAGFAHYQELYSFQVFLYFCNYVFFQLITCQYVLESLKVGEVVVMEYAMVMSVLAIGLTLIVSICFRFERFYQEIAEIKRLSVVILSKYSEGEPRRKAKRVLSLVQEQAPRFSVYGMWQMDAHVTISLFSVITTFLITLFQFAYL